MKSLPDFRIVLCPGRFPEPKHLTTYNAIYKCWHEVWAETFLEVDGNSNLRSDAFTRQDIVAALMYKDQCIAVSLHRYADRESIVTSQDSYFANWTDLHLEKLCLPGPSILVSSYFTIHASARGKNLGIQTKDFLLALTTQVFLDSSCDTMTGAARKNRKVHDITYSWGAMPVGIDVPSGHNDLVDLVAFYRPEVIEKRKSQPITEQFNELWSDKLLIHQQLPDSMSRYETNIQTENNKQAA